MLVRKTRAGGGIDLLTVTLDVDAWTWLITGGVEQPVIVLPRKCIKIVKSCHSGGSNNGCQNDYLTR
jgi:hypothetical protein